MKLLFKPKVSTQFTHVKDYNFREHYPGAHANLAWDTLEPFIRQATKSHILTYIGKEQYDDLTTEYHNDSLSEEQKELVEHLQDAIAYYTAYDAMPILNTNIAAMGVQQAAANDSSSVPTNQWSYKNTRWQTIQKADTFLDQALAYLEDNLSDFTIYQSSGAYRIHTSNFFTTTTTLNAYLNIQSSRRSFSVLSKYLIKAEERYLLPILGDQFFNDLKTKLKDNTLTNLQKTLIPYLQRVVSEYGLFEAIPHLTLIIESDGFKIISSGDGMDDRKNLTNFTHRDAIESLKYKAEENGRTYTADLIKFLFKKVEDYPLWKESDFYKNQDVNNLNNIYTSTCGTGGLFL